MNNIIKRTKRNHDFTILMNEVFKSDLPADTLGVLCFLLHLPDDWVIHKNHIMSKFNMGREKIDRIFKELEKAGFLASFGMIRSSGKYVGRNYMLYDTPKAKADEIKDKPLTAKPLSAKPSTANHTTTKNEYYQELTIPRTNSTNISAKEILTDDDWDDLFKRP